MKRQKKQINFRLMLQRTISSGIGYAGYDFLDVLDKETRSWWERLHK